MPAGGNFIFGYGSIIWRPAMPHTLSVPGYACGWKRRFWQSSPDHRGVPEAPGRVVTLLRDPACVTWGVVFQVDEKHMEQVMADLDHREKAGYEREFVHIHCVDGITRRALLFTASEANEHYAGPAPLHEIARVIDRSVGPSGPNDEYLLRLADALAGLGVVDEHVSALAMCLRAARHERGHEEEGMGSLSLYVLQGGSPKGL